MTVDGAGEITVDGLEDGAREMTMVGLKGSCGQGGKYAGGAIVASTGLIAS